MNYAFYHFEDLRVTEDNHLILGLVCDSDGDDFLQYLEILLPESYFWEPLDLNRSYIMFNPNEPNFENLCVVCDFDNKPLKF